MKKEDLSEAIREGMNKASDDFWNSFTKGLIGAIVIVIILFGIFVYVYNYRMDIQNKKCAEDPSSCKMVGTTQMIREDNEEHIDCYTKLYENDSVFTIVPLDNFEDALAYKQLAEEYLGQSFYEFRCDGFQDKEYLKDFEDYLKNKD